jgi:hypothetical protein
VLLGFVELTICPNSPVSPTHKPLDGHDIVSNAAGTPYGAPVSMVAWTPNVNGPAVAAFAAPTGAEHTSAAANTIKPSRTSHEPQRRPANRSQRTPRTERPITWPPIIGKTKP